MGQNGLMTYFQDGLDKTPRYETILAMNNKIDGKAKAARSLYLLKLSGMPVLRHWPHRDKPFKFEDSEVVKWLMQQPEVMEKAFEHARSSGMIVFNQETKDWKGCGQYNGINADAGADGKNIGGRPSMVNQVLAMDLTEFYYWTRIEGETLSGISKRLEAHLTKKRVDVSLKTCERVILKMAERGDLIKREDGMFVSRGTLHPDVILSPDPPDPTPEQSASLVEQAQMANT